MSTYNKLFEEQKIADAQFGSRTYKAPSIGFNAGITPAGGIILNFKDKEFIKAFLKVRTQFLIKDENNNNC